MLEELERSLPALAGFGAVYRDTLLPQLKVKERKRKIGALLMVLAIPPGIAGPIIIEGKIQGLLLYGWIFAGLAAILFVIGLGQRNSAKKAAKLLLTDRLCELLGVKFNIEPGNDILERFRELELVPSYDSADVEDEVRGGRNGIEFVIQEAHLKRKRRQSSTLGILLAVATQGNNDTIFHGVMSVLDFHKPFSSTIVGVSDQGILNNVKGWFQDGQRVRLESPEFERRFEVYGDDQVEARYLLTPAFMERMVALDKRFHGQIQFAFHKGKFLFSADKQGRWMEARNSHFGVADENYVAHMVEDMTLGFSLIEVMKLDAKTKA